MLRKAGKVVIPKREPPLVAQARAKSVKQRSLFESYLVLDSRTRLRISLALGAFALIGLYAGDLVTEPNLPTTN